MRACVWVYGSDIKPDASNITLKRHSPPPHAAAAAAALRRRRRRANGVCSPTAGPGLASRPTRAFRPGPPSPPLAITSATLQSAAGRPEAARRGGTRCHRDECGVDGDQARRRAQRMHAEITRAQAVISE
jgi:hypothetical protein